MVRDDLGADQFRHPLNRTPADSATFRRRTAGFTFGPEGGICRAMIALFDIGNTHTHIGLASNTRVVRHIDLPTVGWKSAAAAAVAKKFLRGSNPAGAALCSVVPAITPRVARFLRSAFGLGCLELTAATVRGVGIDYPAPRTIGPDRLANAVAVKTHFGAPAVVVDFGTAVTFDVVDQKGDYAGGIIAPGLAAMTDYLHERTALLTRIQIREVAGAVGKNTAQAMLIGAVHGYRGLIRQLIAELKTELGCRRLPVVATGGCGRLIAAKMPEITAVDPLLTLEGLRLVWQAHHART